MEEPRDMEEEEPKDVADVVKKKEKKRKRERENVNWEKREREKT